MTAQETGKWSHGLFGCFDNVGVCVIAYVAPCVTFGQTHARLTENGAGCMTYGALYMVPFLDCFLATQQRGEIRRRRAIEGGALMDLLTVLFCPCCALVQEGQEAMAMEEEITRAHEYQPESEPEPRELSPKDYNQVDYNQVEFNTPAP
jgi:Cys-rich protein (TIGR01571 family)